MRTLIAILLVACLSAATGVAAQEYPTKPIRVLVPYAPGGVVDTTTRIVTNKITERLGWQFVVDNRPGGNGFIAVGIAARGTPDGYTVLSAHTGEFAVSPFVFKGVPFELDRDFTAVVMLSDAPMLVVVNSQSPINSFKDLVAMARAKPGAVTFGSPGSGSVNHLASEWLAVAAGTVVHHDTPSQALGDLVGDDTGGRVHHAPRRVRHQDADRPGGIFLAKSASCDGQEYDKDVCGQ